MMTEPDTPIRETIAAWLRDQGHIATVKADDDRFAEIFFGTRGLRLAVRVDERDPCFLHILLSADIPDGAVDELVALRAAALIESRTKVVKVELHWETRTLTLAAEQFVTEPGGPAIFWRTVSTLEGCFRQSWQVFEEEAGRAAASRFTEQLEAELADGDDKPPASPPVTEDAR